MSAEGVGDNMDETTEPIGPVLLTEGPFAGWMTWGTGSDPFETALGPFCFQVDDGRVRCAFQPTRMHKNGSGAIHGGALMSFADFALFAISYKTLQTTQAVTVTCACEFLSAGSADDSIEATGEVLRETRSLVFVRGLVTQVSRPLLAFSGTLKKIAPRSPRA
jgi:acyl-coenzyme A thioesterase 13